MEIYNPQIKHIFNLIFYPKCYDQIELHSFAMAKFRTRPLLNLIKLVAQWKYIEYMRQRYNGTQIGWLHFYNIDNRLINI